jgi:hypothetical protein
MKTSKPMAKSPIFTLTLFFVLCSLFFCIACDTGSSTGSKSSGGGSGDAKTRSAEKITFGTSNVLSTNISSTKALTDAQWTSVKSKFTNALDKGSKDGPIGGFYTTAFGETNKFNIDLLETTTGYTQYSLDAPNKMLHFKADYVIGLTETELQAVLTGILSGSSMQATVPTPARIAKATQTQRSI